MGPFALLPVDDIFVGSFWPLPLSHDYPNSRFTGSHPVQTPTEHFVFTLDKTHYPTQFIKRPVETEYHDGIKLVRVTFDRDIFEKANEITDSSNLLSFLVYEVNSTNPLPYLNSNLPTKHFYSAEHIALRYPDIVAPTYVVMLDMDSHDCFRNRNRFHLYPTDPVSMETAQYHFADKQHTDALDKRYNPGLFSCSSTPTRWRSFCFPFVRSPFK